MDDSADAAEQRRSPDHQALPDRSRAYCSGPGYYLNADLADSAVSDTTEQIRKGPAFFGKAARGTTAIC